MMMSIQKMAGAGMGAMTMIKRFAVVMSAAMLVACGGGGGSAGTSVFSGSGSGAGTGSGGTPATSAVALSVQLLDASGAPTTALNAGQPLRAQAVLTKNGQSLAGEIVTFSLDQPADLAKIDPGSGAVLSADQGVATVSLSSLGTAAGAGRLVATAVVGGVTATAGANFFASGSSTTTSPTTLTLSGVEISSASVSAYGTTGLKARVLQNGVPFTSPVTVNFSTSCAAGKATVTQSATTQPDGYAVATFVDNGCSPVADTTVTVTASTSTDSKSASFVVRSPTAGSLRFLTVVPSDKSITLKGQGGNGRQENAQLTFKLVDVAGNGVSDAEVCFDSTTYIGGLNLDGFSPTALPPNRGGAALCGNDPISQTKYVKRTNPDGTVSVQINSGTVPTPVRVRARTIYPVAAALALETYSDTLSVSTGLPIQRSFSLSIEKANIDGGDFDGETTTLTARLADQFSNPVPDGTVVNFIASGGAVCTANNGSCKTLDGACSCEFKSQERRPADGRVVVTAYAVGVEDFDDNSGDNVYTPGVDGFRLAATLQGPAQDLGDAYVDANKDGMFSTATINGDTDIPIPYQKNNTFTQGGDGVRGSAHLRASTVIYLGRSSSINPTVVVPLSQLSQERRLTGPQDSSYFVWLKATCPQSGPVPQATVSMLLDDGFGNPMASLTTLAAAAVSSNLATDTFRPSLVLALGARPPSLRVDLPNVTKEVPWSSTGIGGAYNVVTPHSILVKGITDKCSGDATFGLDVKSPRGAVASARVLFEGEPRSTSRYQFDVRYRDQVKFGVAPSGLTVTLTPLGWIAAVSVGVVAQKVTVDWGDGASQTFDALSDTLSAPRPHTYTSAGIKPITVTLTTADNHLYSTTQTVVLQ